MSNALVTLAIAAHESILGTRLAHTFGIPQPCLWRKLQLFHWLFFLSCRHLHHMCSTLGETRAVCQRAEDRWRLLHSRIVRYAR